LEACYCSNAVVIQAAKDVNALEQAGVETFVLISFPDCGEVVRFSTMVTATKSRSLDGTVGPEISTRFFSPQSALFVKPFAM
jgi:hypothetical protein